MYKSYTFKLEGKPIYKIEWLGSVEDFPDTSVDLITFHEYTTKIKFTNLENQISKIVDVKLIDCCALKETKKGYSVISIDVRYWFLNKLKEKTSTFKS